MRTTARRKAGAIIGTTATIAATSVVIIAILRQLGSVSVDGFTQQRITAGSNSNVKRRNHPIRRTPTVTTIIQPTSRAAAAAASFTRRHSIFYDDFEDFYPQQHNNNNNNEEEEIDGDPTIAAAAANGNGNANRKAADADLFASLKARQVELHEEQQVVQKDALIAQEQGGLEQQRLRYNWEEANCLSTVRITFDDWIRRIAIDLYPLIVCGSARGNVYLADVEDGEVLDCLEHVHTSDGIIELITEKRERKNAASAAATAAAANNSSSTATDATEEEDYPTKLGHCLQALYDGHDGNGPLAIAVKKDLIVSSGREGGIHACTIVGTDIEVPSSYGRSSTGTTTKTQLTLQNEGKFRGLEEEVATSSSSKTPPLITSLVFDDRDTLWAGSYDDGIVRGYAYDEYDADDRPLMVRQKSPDYLIQVGAPILDMKIQDDTGILVVTTETKGVFLYSLDESVTNANDDGSSTTVGKKLLLHVNPFSGRSYVTRNGDGTVLSSGQKQFCRTAMIVRNDNSTAAAAAASTNHPMINDITAKELGTTTQSLIIGGSFGHIYQYTIRLYGDTSATATSTTPVTLVSAESMQKIRPKHMGPVVSLASPSPGLFVTASHDGTMRVWDCGSSKTNDDDVEEEVENDNDEDEEDGNIYISVENLVDDEVAKLLNDAESDDDDDDDASISTSTSSSSSSSSIDSIETTTNAIPEEPKKTKKQRRRPRPNVLYALSGYKVWLGSVFANERKLVSDGADNTIIVHSFDEDEDVILRSQQEDDEDDTLGGDEDPFGLLS